MSRWYYTNMVLVKNEYYWDKDAVKLSRIEDMMVDDQSTRKALFEQGELDFTTSVPLASFLRHQQEGETVSKDEVLVNYIECNLRQPGSFWLRLATRMARASHRSLFYTISTC